MFTGIVEELGTVTELDHDHDRGRARLSIGCSIVVDDVAIGDSISVDGACLTVTELSATGFSADLMTETLQATALGTLAPGRTVNLERAMRTDGRLGGHLVQGHVDGVGQLVDRVEHPGAVVLTVAGPPELARYLVPKGSITIAGVSLTVVERDDGGRFTVSLIPHTLSATTLGTLEVGGALNLEVDVIAKYVERLLAAGVTTPYGPAPSEEPR